MVSQDIRHALKKATVVKFKTTAKSIQLIQKYAGQAQELRVIVLTIQIVLNHMVKIIHVGCTINGTRRT